MPDLPAPTRIEARHERTESARLDNFVDGAFAFAITLLIISGGSVPRGTAELEHAMRGIPAFAACFAQLAFFWHGHVQWRDSVRLTDGTSLRLSLLLVFFALIFVFPLHLVYAAFFNTISGGALSPDFVAGPDAAWSLTAMLACYGLSYACMAGTLGLLFRHGLRKASMERADAISARTDVLVWMFCAGVGLFSTVISLCLAPTRDPGIIGFVGGFSYTLLSLTGPLVGRYRRHLEARLPA